MANGACREGSGGVSMHFYQSLSIFLSVNSLDCQCSDVEEFVPPTPCLVGAASSILRGIGLIRHLGLT